MSSFEARSRPPETPIATTPTVSAMNTVCQVSRLPASARKAPKALPTPSLSMPAKAPAAASPV